MYIDFGALIGIIMIICILWLLGPLLWPLIVAGLCIVVVGGGLLIGGLYLYLNYTTPPGMSPQKNKAAVQETYKKPDFGWALSKRIEIESTEITQSDNNRILNIHCKVKKSIAKNSVRIFVNFFDNDGHLLKGREDFMQKRSVPKGKAKYINIKYSSIPSNVHSWKIEFADKVIPPKSALHMKWKESIKTCLKRRLGVENSVRTNSYVGHHKITFMDIKPRYMGLLIVHQGNYGFYKDKLFFVRAILTPRMKATDNPDRFLHKLNNSFFRGLKEAGIREFGRPIRSNNTSITWKFKGDIIWSFTQIGKGLKKVRFTCRNKSVCSRGFIIR